MRLLPHEIAVRILADDLPEVHHEDPDASFTKFDAWQLLRGLTGIDLGVDAKKWQKWIVSAIEADPAAISKLYKSYDARELEKVGAKRLNPLDTDSEDANLSAAKQRFAEHMNAAKLKPKTS